MYKDYMVDQTDSDAYQFWYLFDAIALEEELKAEKNPHVGSKFTDYLAEEGLLEIVTVTAMKRILAWRLYQAMKKQRVTKAQMAKRMKTSRAAVDRLLDEENTSVTLQTMSRAAAVLGKQLTIELRDAG
jgi:hypothetical protein